MSGWSSSTRGNALIACTSRAPAANDPVGKYAFAPSPSTRQSATPSDSRNCFGLRLSVRLIWLVMRALLVTDNCCEALAQRHVAYDVVRRSATPHDAIHLLEPPHC